MLVKGCRHKNKIPIKCIPCNALMNRSNRVLMIAGVVPVVTKCTSSIHRFRKFKVIIAVFSPMFKTTSKRFHAFVINFEMMGKYV